MEVNSCGVCPFFVEETDFHAVGNYTIAYCNLSTDKGTIASYDMDQREDIPEIGQILHNCPLKQGEVTVKLSE